jgi:hypothetical protein
VRGHDTRLHAPNPRERREVRCPECGWRWEVGDHTEYGLGLPERDDLACEGYCAQGEA